MKKPRRAAASKLPQRLRPFFPDDDFDRLSWKADRDLIICRILKDGDWKSLGWLRRRFPDDELRTWLLERRGAELSSKHLRFWELILKLPRRQVNAWLADPAQKVRDEEYKRQMQKYDFWSQR